MSPDEYEWRPERPAPPPIPPAAPRQRPSSSPVLVLLLTLVTLGGWLLVGYMLMRGYWPQGNDGQPRAVTPRGDLMDLEKTTIAIYNNAKPSVVHITTLAVRRDRWNLNVQQVPEGTGSGFVWDKDGHIVTNFHVVQSVVQNNGAVQVTMADQSNWHGTVVGYYPDKDIAVIYVGARRAS